MILQVYGDESYTTKAEVFCGFIATPDEWKKFSIRWKTVLNDFSVGYFHFREFADKGNRHKIPNNPFLPWNNKKRDRFLIELAIVLSEFPVPIGGILNRAEFDAREMEKETDSRELLIAQFYVHFSQRLNSYWPGFNGQVSFVFDETDNENWITAITKIHKRAQKREPRIGGLVFENDVRCPPLQAADFYAYISRQNTEKYYAQGMTRQLKRIHDWIISKNNTPKFKSEHTQEWWEKLVRTVLADRKQKMSLWAKQGKRQTYFPELHFEPQKHGYTLVDANE